MERRLCCDDRMAVGILHTPAEIEALLAVFEQIAQECSWEPGSQLIDYRDSSMHLAVFEGESLAGGLQLALPGKTGTLPCLTVWPELEISGRLDVADVALIAFLPQCRGRKRLFWGLLVELWRYCAANG